MSDLLWHMPGPRLFLRRAIDHLREGCSLLIETKRESDAADPSFAEQIAGELNRIGATAYVVAANENEDPRLALVQEGLLENKLATDEEICDKLGNYRIIVDNRQHPRCPWVAMAWRLRHLIRQRPTHERPAFVVVCQPQPANAGSRDDVAMKTLNWDTALTHSDMLALADALRPRGKENPIIRKLAVHIAAHLCENNITRLESLSQMGSSELLRVTHARDGELVWRAQIEVLFPWIEERRLEIFPKVASSLPEGHEGIAKDDLEIGQIAHLCSQTGSRGKLPEVERRRICALRDLRNNLAHRHPVPERNIIKACE